MHKAELLQKQTANRHHSVAPWVNVVRPNQTLIFRSRQRKFVGGVYANGGATGAIPNAYTLPTHGRRKQN